MIFSIFFQAEPTDPKEFDDPQVFDAPVISNESSDQVFDHPQVFGDTKVISNGSRDFDNPKVYGDTSIFNILVRIYSILLKVALLNGAPIEEKMRRACNYSIRGKGSFFYCPESDANLLTNGKQKAYNRFSGEVTVEPM